MDFHKGRIDSLQALRGIAALFIILEHVRAFNCGAFGVDIFFCLSGFIMMYSTHKDTKHFLAKRLIRILPLYYLFTLFTYLVMAILPGLFETSTARPIYLIKSLLFIPFDIGDGVLQPLMRIGWTVNCEVFFYLLFLIAMKISHRFRALLASAMIVALIAADTLLQLDFAPLRFYGRAVMFDFVLGFMAYYLAQKIYSRYTVGKLPKAISAVAYLLAAVLLLWLMINKQGSNIQGLRQPIVWGLPSMVIVLCFYVGGLHIKPLESLVTLGNISFSVYFMHYYIVMFLDRKVFDFSAFSLSTLCGTALAIFATVLLSLISYELIEQRFCHFLRERLLTKSQSE